MSSDEHAAATLKAYFRVFGALMVLTALTVAVAYVDLGRWNDFVALSIAITKGVLVVLIFMHVRESSRAVWLFAGAGFFWLLIFLAFVFADYSVRDWMPYYGVDPGLDAAADPGLGAVDAGSGH